MLWIMGQCFGKQNPEVTLEKLARQKKKIHEQGIRLKSKVIDHGNKATLLKFVLECRKNATLHDVLVAKEKHFSATHDINEKYPVPIFLNLTYFDMCEVLRLFNTYKGNAREINNTLQSELQFVAELNTLYARNRQDLKNLRNMQQVLKQTEKTIEMNDIVSDVSALLPTGVLQKMVDDTGKTGEKFKLMEGYTRDIQATNNAVFMDSDNSTIEDLAEAFKDIEGMIEKELGPVSLPNVPAQVIATDSPKELISMSFPG
jgi:hypothetical protein